MAASSTARAGRASTHPDGKGYNVTIVQNPTTSLADDVAATRRAIAAQDGPVILVGHSYGGVVITEAGNRPEGEGAGLYRRLRARQRRIGRVADRQSAARARRCRRSCRRRTASCSSIAKVRRLLRGRCGRRRGRLHGGLPSALGRRRARRRSHRAGVEGEAQLVSGRHRRPHDPARRAALHGQARRRRGRPRPRGSHAIYVSKPEAVADLLERAAAGAMAEAE